METTQKTREEAVQREKRQNAPVKHRPAARETAPPPSAQQNNGAARTAEEQRSAAAAPRQPRAKQEEAPAAQRQRQAAPAKKKASAEEKPRKAPQKKKAPAKKEAPAQKAAPAKKAAPARKAVPAKKRPAPKKDPEDISTKKRAYGNSKPKKKSTVEKVSDLFKQSTEKKASKKGKGNRPKQPTPAVIYTQPQAFNRNRLFMQLLTAVAIVVALVLGLSVFFKVDESKIMVSGAEVYSEWAIKEASGLEDGENLLTFSHARAAAQIKANLPYVDTVRFGIKLPDTVNIIVKEDDVVYAIKDSTGTWWLINSDGRVVEMGNDAKASKHTQILGVTLENPIPDERGVATEAIPTETDASGEFIPVTTTGAQRLNAALQIVKALEANDIVGSAASVDVTRIEDIILWYGSRYQVNLGDSARLDYKIACMNDVILQMSDYQSGILDISFTIWPNQVGYTPFA